MTYERRTREVLNVEIVNDGTGDVVIGNYYYVVTINGHMIARGMVRQHVRENGWEELVFKLASEAILKGNLK